MFGVINMVTVAVSATVRTCEEDLAHAGYYIATALKNIDEVIDNDYPNSNLTFTFERMNQTKLALKQAEVDCESSYKCRNDIDKLQEEVGLITLNMTQAVTDCRNSSDRKWVRNFENGV